MNEKQKKENKIISIGLVVVLMISAFYVLKSFSSKEEPEVTKDSPQKSELFKDYSYMTPAELNKKISDKEKIILLDPRDSVSYSKNHIENSILVTTDNLKQVLSGIEKETQIIIIGYDYENKKDEAALIKALKDSGFKSVKALSGGITGWAEDGYQMISGGNKESALDWSKIDQILPEQLKLAIENKYPVFILDIRQPFLYSSGHIPGATNIPLEDLEKRKMEVPLSKEVLVYGASADDDFKASVKLNDLGFLATFTLKGGFSAWQEKRFDLEK